MHAHRSSFRSNNPEHSLFRNEFFRRPVNHIKFNQNFQSFSRAPRSTYKLRTYDVQCRIQNRVSNIHQAPPTLYIYNKYLYILRKTFFLYYFIATFTYTKFQTPLPLHVILKVLRNEIFAYRFHQLRTRIKQHENTEFLRIFRYLYHIQTPYNRDRFFSFIYLLSFFVCQSS